MYVATGILVATSVALVVYVCVIRKRIAKTNDRFSALEQTMAQHQWNCPQNLDDAGCIRGAPNVHSSAPDDRMTQNIELEHQSNGDVDITIHRTRVVEVEHETY